MIRKPALNPGFCFGAVVAWTLYLSVWSNLTLAQSGSSAASLGRVPGSTFDVISIRPSNANENKLQSLELSSDEYRAVGLPLWNTIMKAYYPTAYWDEDRIVGAPSWVMNERYTIRGKVSADKLQEWQAERHNWSSLAEDKLLRAMLQSALSDRCHLAVHRIPATIKGFVLIVDKAGIRRATMREAKPDEKIPGEALQIAGGAKMIPTLPDQKLGLTFFQSSMIALAAQLSNYGAPVIDKTGLTDRYDFFLPKFSEDGDPSIDWDLKSLGLKLKETNVPMDKLVIDHIEKPSPN